MSAMGQKETFSTSGPSVCFRGQSGPNINYFGGPAFSHKRTSRPNKLPSILAQYDAVCPRLTSIIFNFEDDICFGIYGTRLFLRIGR